MVLSLYLLYGFFGHRLLQLADVLLQPRHRRPAAPPDWLSPASCIASPGLAVACGLSACRGLSPSGIDISIIGINFGIIPVEAAAHTLADTFIVIDE
jgi:hypothetical protein